MNLQLVGTIRDNVHRINAFAISPDNQTLVSASRNSTVRIWNILTGELLHTLTAHTKAVYSVAISPDGKILVTGSEDLTIKIWNLQTGELILNLTGHNDWNRLPDVKGQAKCLAISPDGQFLACARQYGDEIQLFELKNGSLISSLSGGWEPCQIIFSADGKFLAGCLNDEVKVWYVPSLELYSSCEFFGFESATAISPDMKTAACSYYKGGGIRLINTKTGEEFNALSHVGEECLYDESASAEALCFSPDGQFFVSSGNNIIQIWDIQTWQILCTTNISKTWSSEDTVMIISPNNQMLAVGDYDGGIQIWQINLSPEIQLNEIEAYIRNTVPDDFNPDYIDNWDG